jgi:hypothetical protein
VRSSVYATGSMKNSNISLLFAMFSADNEKHHITTFAHGLSAKTRLKQL